MPAVGKKERFFQSPRGVLWDWIWGFLQARVSQQDGPPLTGGPKARSLTFSGDTAGVSSLGLDKSLDLGLCVIPAGASSRPTRKKLVHQEFSASKGHTPGSAQQGEAGGGSHLPEQPLLWEVLGQGIRQAQGSPGPALWPKKGL